MVRRRALATLAAGFLTLVVAGSCSPVPSKGTMPPPGPDGQVDADTAPDFIAVAGISDDTIGYVPKRFLLPDPTGAFAAATEEIPVYAGDVQTLIGHMVPGKGFVPLGVDPRTLPDKPIQVGPSLDVPSSDASTVTFYVRSRLTRTAWFAVRTGAGLEHAGGFNAGVAVGCIRVGPDEDLVAVDRSPVDPSAHVTRSVFTQGATGASPTLWADVAADGTMRQGEGVPPWWPDAPQTC